MAAIALKKLLRKDVNTLLHNLVNSLQVAVAIHDEHGALLWGAAAAPEAAKYPILLDEETLGWVAGPAQAELVATLLSHLASREYEKRSLSVETLERYKEINLLYTVSQKMASCLNPQAVAQLVIDEAIKIITADSASVMLVNEETQALEMIASYGTAETSDVALNVGEGLAGNVVVTGKGDIYNDVRRVPEFIVGKHQISSMICAPLRVEEKILGVMNVNTIEPVLYTAGDLKLLTALATQAAVSIENARLHAEHLERERIVKELEIARNIQQTLLPQWIPPLHGGEMAAISIPAKEVGGDFYDFIPQADQQLGLVIADVSGKGVPAALFMALSKALMRANAMRNPEVAHAVEQTNRLILECATSGLFVTLFYAIIDPLRQTLRYVSAGHNPPLIFHPATHEFQLLEADGIALGVIDEIHLDEAEVTFQTGDVIVLYTDGVTEAMNVNNDEFGEERLKQVIQDHHHTSARELLAAIQEAILDFTAGEAQFDDITLMIVKMI